MIRDTKRDVCRTLTNVVRQSVLAEEIDPKSFFMMLNNNFNMLFHHGTMDLTGVWDAIAPTNPAPPLYGLFLAFEDAAHRRGFKILQPVAVQGLSPEQRQSYAGLAGTDGGPADVVEIGDDEFFNTDPNAEAISLSLGSQDLKPFIPEEFRRDVVQLVVDCLKTAPVGEMLDAGQLAYLVDSNFADLCDGQRFNFEPILDGLRQLEGVTDSDVYVGIVALERALLTHNLVLEPLQLDIDAALAQRLSEEAERTARADAEEAAVRTRPRAGKLDRPNRDAEDAPLVTPPATGGDAREQRLRKWGLVMLSDRQIKAVRIGILAFGLMTIATFGYVFREDRTLDIDDFRESVPMVSARLDGGAFNSVVDDSNWWKLPTKVREAKVEKLQNYMLANGWIPNAQVRDKRGRLLLVGVGGKKLAVTRFFVAGTEDGNVPEDARVRSPNAPEDNRGTTPAKSK